MGGIGAHARAVWRSYVPARVRHRIGDLRQRGNDARWRRPRRLGELRRTTPFSTWGKSRGGAIDRFYVDRYLKSHIEDIHGRVLEIAGDEYARRFGHAVRHIDVLDIEAGNPKATFVGDIADAPSLPDDTFDCVLVTQLLMNVWDVRGAFATCYRILRPGGVLLVTVPGITRITPVEAERYGHWWNFTPMSAERVAAESFGSESVEVATYGNVLSAAAFLFGLGLHDVRVEELEVHDPAFPVTIGVRAVKRSVDGSSS